MASKKKTTLLKQGYGVGGLFAIINNNLYLETDENIAKFNLASNELLNLMDKDLYVSSASTQGITAYSGSDWFFYAWDSPEPYYFKNYQNPLTDGIYLMSLNENNYIILNKNDFSCTIYCYDEVKREEHVISACLADHALILYIQGDQNIVRLYNLNDTIEWKNDITIDSNSLSLVYQIENKIIMMNDHQELSIIPLVL